MFLVWAAKGFIRERLKLKGWTKIKVKSAFGCGICCRCDGIVCKLGSERSLVIDMIRKYKSLEMLRKDNVLSVGS